MKILILLNRINKMFKCGLQLKMLIGILIILVSHTFTILAQNQSQVYYRGEFNGWGTTAMSYSLGHWRVTIQCTANDNPSEFKFDDENADWSVNWGAADTAMAVDTRYDAWSGGGNGGFNAIASRYYTFTFKDVPDGSNSDCAVMETSAAPISITNVSDNSGGSVGINESVRVRIELSAAKSPEENIYVRYSSDGWASDGFVLAVASNTTIYTCSIPAQNKLCTVSYYVLTTTLTWASGNDLDNYPDLMTIKYNNNNGSNYSYEVNKIGSKTIDGSASDWKGVAPAIPNISTISSNEWIWKDKENDMRTDPSDPLEPNYDLTEARITADSNYIFFLFKFRDITSTDEPYVGISIDIDTNSSDTGMNWIADDSETLLGGDYTTLPANAHYGEYNLIIHNPISGVTKIERYTNTGSWHSPPSPPYDTGCYISVDSNIMEVAIARADVGLTGNITARFTIALFDNNVGWANVTNVGEYFGSDALDSISIISNTTGTNAGVDMDNDPEYTLSAWDEDISDGDIDFWFDIRFTTSGKISNTPPNPPTNPSPADGSTNVGTFTPTLSWFPATDPDTGDAVTGYLLELSTTTNLDGIVLYRVNINGTNWTTPTLPDGVTIYWRVRARDRTGALSDSPIWTFATPYLPSPAPTVPVFTPIIDGVKDSLWGNNMSCTSCLLYTSPSPRD